MNALILLAFSRSLRHVWSQLMCTNAFWTITCCSTEEMKCELNSRSKMLEVFVDITKLKTNGSNKIRIYGIGGEEYVSTLYFSSGSISIYVEVMEEYMFNYLHFYSRHGLLKLKKMFLIWIKITSLHH